MRGELKQHMSYLYALSLSFVPLCLRSSRLVRLLHRLLVSIDECNDLSINQCRDVLCVCQCLINVKEFRWVCACVFVSAHVMDPELATCLLLSLISLFVVDFKTF